MGGVLPIPLCLYLSLCVAFSLAFSVSVSLPTPSVCLSVVSVYLIPLIYFSLWDVYSLAFSVSLSLPPSPSPPPPPPPPSLSYSPILSVSFDSGDLDSSRGVPQFGAMIYCGTGRNPLDYDGYGCFCGIGGEGKPLDDLDRYEPPPYHLSSSAQTNQ